LAEQAYILFYANRGTPWFSDYIQIHRPFVCLVTPTTSNDASDEPTLMPELNNVEDNNSYGKLIFYTFDHTQYSTI